MKHEIYNSILATLALLVGAISLFVQFWPQADHLEVVAETRVGLQMPVQVTDHALLNQDSGTLGPAFGPVTWKVRLHNTSDRTVSVVSYELLGLARGKIYETNGFKDMLSPLSSPMSQQQLPDNIGPRETKAYLISLMVPLEADENDISACEDENSSIGAFERCFLKRGKDTFGNPVEAYLDNSGEFIGASWTEAGTVPNFLLVFETADGSEFSTVFGFLPF